MAVRKPNCWKVSKEGGTIAACPMGTSEACLSLMAGQSCPADKKVIM